MSTVTMASTCTCTRSGNTRPRAHQHLQHRLGVLLDELVHLRIGNLDLLKNLLKVVRVLQYPSSQLRYVSHPYLRSPFLYRLEYLPFLLPLLLLLLLQLQLQLRLQLQNLHQLQHQRLDAKRA